MRVQKLSSADLRKMIAKSLLRDVCDVQESCKDDGFMTTSLDVGHDTVSIFIPIDRYLCAYYDVDDDRVKLFRNDYDWTYRAEVTLDA